MDVDKHPVGGAAVLEDLIPGLKPDIALYCLALLPCTYYSKIRSVCRLWRSLVHSGELYGVRKSFGLLRPALFLLLEDCQVGGLLHLICHEPENGQWMELPPLLPSLLGPTTATASAGTCTPMNGAFGPAATAAAAAASGEESKFDPAEPVEGFAVVASESRLFVLGGMHRLADGTDSCLPTTAEFDVCQGRWLSKACMHVARCLFAAGAVGNEIVVAGGIIVSANSFIREHTLTAEAFCPSSDSWRVLPSLQVDRHWGVDFGIVRDERLAVMCEESALSEAFDRVRCEWSAVLVPPLPSWTKKVSVMADGRLCVLQNMWPLHMYRVLLQEGHSSVLLPIGQWDEKTRSRGGLSHPREIVPVGRKIFVIGNEHPRAIRRRHGFQGPSPLQVSSMDLTASNAKWQEASVDGLKVLQQSSWVMGSAVINI